MLAKSWVSLVGMKSKDFATSGLLVSKHQREVFLAAPGSLGLRLRQGEIVMNSGSCVTGRLSRTQVEEKIVIVRLKFFKLFELNCDSGDAAKTTVYELDHSSQVRSLASPEM